MAQSTESLLHAHLGALRRRWPAGLAAGALVLALAVPVALGLPNLYRSSATLVVDQAPDPLTQASQQMLEVSGQLQTIRQEALSRQRVLQWVEELGLYPELRDAGMVDSVIAVMQRDVKVEPLSASRGDGRVTTVSFRVSYTGNDPVKVAAAANRLATYYVERSGALRSRMATRTTDAARAELDQVRARLESQTRAVNEYMARNASALPAQVSSIQAKYTQVSSQLSANAAEIGRQMERRGTLQMQLAQLQTPSAAADQTDPAIRLERARRELQNLLDRFEEAHYEVRSKRAEITNLERLVAQRGTGGSAPAESPQITTLRSQLSEVNAQIEKLQNAGATLQSDLAKFDAILDAAPLRSADLDRLTSEAAATRTLYNNLTTQYQQALSGERQTGEGSQQFQILDPAVAAEAPSAPDRRLLLVFSAVLAVLAGLGTVMLRDRLDRSFRTVDELRAFTHVPVLATIPQIVSKKARTRRLVVGGLTATAVGVGLVFVSVGVFQVAKQAEALTRMLLR
jgi:polysaccharide chain length determinant protein (PEP-CTERM system associated)